MKKLMKSIALLLALVSALILLPTAALAAPADYELPAFSRVWGTIKELSEEENGNRSVWISDGTGKGSGVVLYVTDSTPIVDDVTGKPVDFSELKEGDAVYGWYGPYMTMSLPPQSTAVALVVNIPADHGAGQLQEVTYASVDADGTLALAFERSSCEQIASNFKITRFGTDETVDASALHPGSRVIFWEAENRMVLLDSPYENWITVALNGTVSVNGKALSAKAQIKDDETYLPLSHVAQKLGYKVTRNVDRTRYTIKKDGKTVLTITVGSDRFQNAEGGDVATSPAFVENNRLYAPLSMLAFLSGDIWF